jgi:hypothetical protein
VAYWASSEAMTAAEGILRASSAAKVGPESTAKRDSRSAAIPSSNETWLIRARVSISIPLVPEINETRRSFGQAWRS